MNHTDERLQWAIEHVLSSRLRPECAKGIVATAREILTEMDKPDGPALTPVTAERWRRAAFNALDHCKKIETERDAALAKVLRLESDNQSLGDQLGAMQEMRDSFKTWAKKFESELETVKLFAHGVIRLHDAGLLAGKGDSQCIEALRAVMEPK